MEANLTEQALATAMKKLLSQMPLSKISVKDLTDECHINRKTYYYHFKDKYDLIHWIFLDEFYRRLDYDEIHTIWDFLEPLSIYFYENKTYYKSVFEYKGQNNFTSFFREIIEPLLKEHFENIFAKNEFYGLYADYATAGFVLVFERWLRDYDYIEPEAFLRIMKNAVVALANHVLDEEQILDSEDD